MLSETWNRPTSSLEKMIFHFLCHYQGNFTPKRIRLYGDDFEQNLLKLATAFFYTGSPLILESDSYNPALLFFLNHADDTLRSKIHYQGLSSAKADISLSFKPRSDAFSLEVCWDKDDEIAFQNCERVERFSQAFIHAPEMKENSFFSFVDHFPAVPQPLFWQYAYPYLTLKQKAHALGKKLDGDFLPSLFPSKEDPLLSFVSNHGALSPQGYETLVRAYHDPPEENPLFRLAYYEHELWEIRSLAYRGYETKREHFYHPFPDLVKERLDYPTWEESLLHDPVVSDLLAVLSLDYLSAKGGLHYE